MIVLSCKKLCVSFGARAVIEDASFSLNEGDRASLVGPNGVGKTTLLRLLSGELASTGGQISRAPGKTLGVLSQHALCAAEKTVFEEALLAHGPLLELSAPIHEAQEEVQSGSAGAATRLALLSERFEREGGLTYVSRTRSALCSVGFEPFLDREVQTLSGGQKTTLALVKLLLSAPDILLLDEPTNHLDIRALSWLESTLLSMKSTLLVVSHDRYFLDRVTQRTIDLDHGETAVYDLNYSAFRDAKKERAKITQKQYDLQQKEIRRQEAIIKKQRQFNRERNIIAAESREKAIARMEKLEKPKSEIAPPWFSFRAVPSPHDVLRASHLSFRYGEKYILKDFSLEVFQGERLFLVGEVGSGKSTLLKLLCGVLMPQEGRVSPGVGVHSGYYDQENQNLSEQNMVLEELYQADSEQNEGELRSYLAAFRFVGERVFQRVSSLSGGERARLSLAKLMRGKYNLLFLDEPTNHLDMDSKEALEEALLSYPGTSIIVSHDRYFIRRLATKLYFLEPGSAPLFLPGGAERLDEFYQNLGFAKVQGKKQSSQKEQYLQRKKDDAAARKRENDLKHTRIAIDEAESAIETVHAQIALYEDDYQKLELLYEARGNLEMKLEGLYETLFELQE